MRQAIYKIEIGNNLASMENALIIQSAGSQIANVLFLYLRRVRR
ncbi:MAG: hypothetical protein ABR584_01155 [Candidatus Baltobacteraceae bacterium]